MLPIKEFSFSPPKTACQAIWISGEILIWAKLADVKLNYSDRTTLSKIRWKKQ